MEEYFGEYFPKSKNTIYEKKKFALPIIFLASSQGNFIYFRTYVVNNYNLFT